jgi:hypothetical protein
MELMPKVFITSDISPIDVFTYKDGELFWNIKPTFWINIGDLVGSKRKDGYWETQYKGKRYLVHRLIFLYHHGYLPSLIDHIDQNPSNNKIENLRESNKRANAFNCGIPSNNKSGVRGVSWCKNSKKWVARFKKEGKYLFLGAFEDINKAKEIRQFYEKGGV